MLTVKQPPVKRLPLPNYFVQLPRLVELPAQKWRVFARIGKRIENYMETKRTEWEYAQTAERYKKDADFWDSRYFKHHERIALLLERAADCMDEAYLLNAKRKYLEKGKKLREDAIERYDEYPLFRRYATPEGLEGQARCHRKLRQTTEAETYETMSNEMRTQMECEPVFLALITIYQWRNAIMEELYEPRKEPTVYEMLIEISNLVRLAKTAMDSTCWLSFSSDIKAYIRGTASMVYQVGGQELEQILRETRDW
ncbi:MAG: hypothetical protein AABW86_05315 [Candidatus Micrarchaeota archaeon]